jgi:hypothetical protein
MFLISSRGVRNKLLLAVLGLAGSGLCLYPLFSRSHSNVESITLRPVHVASELTSRDRLGLLRPVSICPSSVESYLVCNYDQLVEVDPRLEHATCLRPYPELPAWHPTGVCFRDGLIFIANYTGHDLLVMQRSGDRLTLVQRIVHDGMQSPENVALSANGQLIGVADYDGGRLWMFHRDGELAWSAELTKAHGVAFGPDFVVATGLEDRVIRKYDLSGNVLASHGSLGFGDGKYLWPTCVIVRDHRILVSDAHTGKISVLDRDLRFRDWFGGNGPGPGLFNMPYAIDGRRGELVICDTFKNRLVFLHDSGDVARVRGHDEEQAKTPAPRYHFRNGYINLAEPAFVRLPRLPQELWYPGYGRYWFGPRSKPKCVVMPQLGSVYNGANAPYFAWVTTVTFRDQKYTLLGHSENGRILIVDPRGRCCVCDDECLWRVDGVLRTGSGETFDPTQVLESAVERFSRFDCLVEQGFDLLPAAANLLERSNVEGLAASFVTPAGKQFWESWQAARTPEEKQAAAREFDAALAREKDCIYLQEYFLRNTLCPE